ncbi:Fatty acyl-CoA reductase [Artemisia annua]|uniref:Fatty acyl-CoA reductase n=1 Tax=Artemisia annua TaxID=35608 RepID=A0A2U1P3F2_ARTAN|nr:Fatty acyl-CoA reductase [Artemisia annua]
MNTFISEKVTAVAGDIGVENFGVLNSDLFKEMWEQVDVIVNSAATTNYDERYDMAFATNTLGAKHVSSFVNQCINIKVLLHVSTGLYIISYQRTYIIVIGGEMLEYGSDLRAGPVLIFMMPWPGKTVEKYPY